MSTARPYNRNSPRTYNRHMYSSMNSSFGTQQGYITPDSNKKTMKGVIATPNSPDRDTASKLSGSRALSRDMYMNTPIATAMVRRVRTNVVGSGLRPKPVIDAEFLGLSKEEARKWETHTHREFKMWADTHKCDATGRMNFWDLQAQAFLTVLLSGDCFLMLPWQKEKELKGWPYELKVRLIEADLVRNPPETHFQFKDLDQLEASTVSGIEINKKGRVKSAWFADHYPGHGILNSQGKFAQIKRFHSSGRQNWYQLAEFERINQRRGMPMLAPVLDMMKTMSRHSESELIGALIASTFTVFVKDQSGMGNTLNSGFTPEESVIGGGTSTDSDGKQVQETPRPENALDLELGSGVIHYLDDDKDIIIADPKRPNAAFEPFFNAMATQIASAVELPVEQVLLKFTTSYTAARAALLEVWKMYIRRRHWLVRELCTPVYTEFITEAVLKGRIVAPGFFDDPAIKNAWCNALWIGPGNGQLDPLKESKAAVLKLGAKLTTHQKEYVQDTGEDWEMGMVQREREEQILKDRGLSTELEPGEIQGPDGVKNPEETKKEQDEEEER